MSSGIERSRPIGLLHVYRAWARVLACIGVVWIAAASRAQAQDLGHKLLGTLGIGAGRQAPAGAYVGERVGFYRATRVNERNGRALDVEGFRLDAVANAIGVAGVVAIPNSPFYYAASLALPTAWIRLDEEVPQASFDRAGLGDFMFEPAQFGMRVGRASLIGEYILYLPSGHFELNGGNISEGHITQQVSLGGAIDFDPGRHWFAGAVLSYAHNHKKRGIDIERGDTLQVQGGAGVRPAPAWELGVAGYALWQVEDDHGADVPPVLRGGRDRAYALGPELALLVLAWSLELRLRYEFEFAVESRPQGQIGFLEITFATSPSAPPPPKPAAQP